MNKYLEALLTITLTLTVCLLTALTYAAVRELVFGR